MQRKLTLELGYEPSVTELADALDMSEDKVNGDHADCQRTSLFGDSDR